MNVLLETVKNYEATVVALNDPKIIETAMRLSYYTAMVDAAKDDPMDDQEAQNYLLNFFQTKIQYETERFQTLVNDLL